MDCIQHMVANLILVSLVKLGSLATLVIWVILDFSVISVICETLFWVFLEIWDSLVTLMNFSRFFTKNDYFEHFLKTCL